MKRLYIKHFNLQATIESGQIFRWWKRDDDYFVCMRNTLFQFRQEGDMLFWDGVRLDGGRVAETTVIHLFRLDEDYEQILDSISVDKHMRKVVKMYRGLRILRQDPWECLISFLSTMVSNIPKHSGVLKKACEMFGSKIELNGFTAYTFPKPGELPDESGLRNLGFGFRAPYIAFANSVCNNRNLAGIALLPFAEAKSALMKFPGVGNKVADCVLLFSLGFIESFPVDIWVKRAVEDLYFDGDAKEHVIGEFGCSYFGKYAGYAQQFLFHWRRLA